MRPRPEIAPTSEDFDRIVIVTNPTSTRAAQIHHLIDELEASTYGKRLHTIHTKADIDSTTEILQNTLHPGDVVVVAGGDGTVHQIINALANGTLLGQRIPILPLWGGNGNDMAHMLNGRSTRRPSKLLQQGKVTAIYPIQVHYTSDEDNAQRLAGYCVGIGATAYGALCLNEAAYRRRIGYKNKFVRQLYEAHALTKALSEISTYTIEDGQGIRTIFERTIANGPRMAKYGKLPVKLTEQRLFVTDIAEKHTLAVAGWLGRLVCQPLVGPPSGYYLEGGQELSFAIRHKPTFMHFDAETHVLPPDSEVHITQASHPFYAISTKLFR